MPACRARALPRCDSCGAVSRVGAARTRRRCRKRRFCCRGANNAVARRACGQQAAHELTIWDIRAFIKTWHGSKPLARATCNAAWGGHPAGLATAAVASPRISWPLISLSCCINLHRRVPYCAVACAYVASSVYRLYSKPFKRRRQPPPSFYATSLAQHHAVAYLLGGEPAIDA